jgi:probable HAF family extracellular repeat protein
MKYESMIIAGVFVCLTMASAAIGNAQSYTITDLGSLNPTGINAWAQVVGNNNNHAFLWTRWNGMTDLGLLPGGTFSMAASINDLGVVVGTADGTGTVTFPDPSDNQQCSGLTQPFVWKPRNGMKGLGTSAFYDAQPWVYYPCAVSLYALGSNDLGTVVGYSNGMLSYQWGFSWTPGGGYNPTGFLNGSWPPTSVNAVNNKGQIVGQYSFFGEDGYAASSINGVAVDLGTLTGAGPSSSFYVSSSANDVNDVGQVVGWSDTADCNNGCNFHAALWNARGTIQDLGTLPGDSLSAALKINYFGQVIGSSGNLAVPTINVYGSPEASEGVSGRPFVWTARRGMQDLNTLVRANSGWVLNSVTDINLWGQIVGSGTYKGQTHGFLLTPTSFDNLVTERALRGLTHEAALTR